MPETIEAPPMHLPCRFIRSDAERFFSRPGWARLFGLLGKPPLPNANRSHPNSQVPFIELVWMPWFAVEFSTEMRGRLNSVTTALDAWSGMVVLFERINALREGTPEGAVFPPPFGPEQASSLSRQGLFQVILRRRGQLNKPLIQECISVRLFHMPYWVYYYRRFLRLIDVRLMDAYAGNAPGARIRNGLLNALVTHSPTSGPQP